MSRLPNPLAGAPRRMPSRMRVASTLGALCALVAAGPALAFDPDPPAPGDATPSHLAPGLKSAAEYERVEVDPAPAADEESATLMQRVSRRLGRIPLRPVQIGETPRTPDDPEPGAGVTVFIRF